MMKKGRRMISAIIAAAMLFSLPVQAAGSATADDQEPIIGGKISSAQVQKGDILRYSFSVSNAKLQVQNPLFRTANIMRITWTSSSGQTIVQDLNNAARIEGTLEILDGMQPGKWSISSICFLEPYKEHYGDTKGSEGLTVSATGDNLIVIKDDFSFSEFTVSGTTADTQAPVLRKKSFGLTKEKLGKKGKTVFYLKAGDKSPMRYVYCGWRNTATKETTYADMTYNASKKRYEYKLSAADFDGKGRLRLVRVAACDRYGNKTNLKGAKLPKLTITCKK